MFSASGQVATVDIEVDVTFLHMDKCPSHPFPDLPAGYRVRHVRHPEVAFYLKLYTEIGAPYCWWMRRVAPYSYMRALLSNSDIEIYVLEHNDHIAGFFELDRRNKIDVNLSYFGLMPNYIGKKLGFAFLGTAIHLAWRTAPDFIRVNTCTADHIRALPFYLKSGFVIDRVVKERWAIPVSLGLNIPEHLKIAP